MNFRLSYTNPLVPSLMLAVFVGISTRAWDAVGASAALPTSSWETPVAAAGSVGLGALAAAATFLGVVFAGSLAAPGRSPQDGSSRR